MRERNLAAAAVLFALALPVAGQDLLDASQAFRTSARRIGADVIEVRYDTAPGYYLYRDRLEFKLQPESARLGAPKLPPGKVKEDEFFGRSVIYRNRTIVQLPITAMDNSTVTLTADLQGCADIGVCYPPVRRTFVLAAPSKAR